MRSLLYLPADWLRRYLERHRKYQLYSSEPYYVVQLRCTSTLPGIYEDSDAFHVKIHKPAAYHVTTNAPVYHRGMSGSAKSFSSSAVSFVNVRFGKGNEIRSKSSVIFRIFSPRRLDEYDVHDANYPV